jgi:hypothetical protein
MLKKQFVVAIAAVLTITVMSPRFAEGGSKADREARFAARVKAGILTLGVGAQARVEVKLRDKRSLTGYVSEAGDNEFVVKDSETGTATVVPYSDVAKVKGNNLSKGAKIVIGVSIAAAIIIVLYLVRGAFCDGC